MIHETRFASNRKNQGSVYKSWGLASPREILEDANQLRRVTITCTDRSVFVYSMWNKRCPFYDLRAPRIWRHPNPCKDRTELVALVPQVHFPAHAFRTILVPCALPSFRFANSIYFHLEGLDLSPRIQ